MSAYTLTVTVDGPILEVEGFIDQGNVVERPPVDLWRALGSVAGRWLEHSRAEGARERQGIASLLLTLAVEQQGGGQNQCHGSPNQPGNEGLLHG